MEDFRSLIDAIHRVLPESQLKPVSTSNLLAIQRTYPDVPNHYLSFLQNVGFGSLGDSYFAIYSGLIKPGDIYGGNTPEALANILFFGDNFAGWMVGFDKRNDWQIVGVDSGRPIPTIQEEKTIAEFIAKEVANCEPE